MAPAIFQAPFTVAVRVAQIIFCVVCLATAGATANSFRGQVPDAVGFAIFANVFGLLVSTLLLLLAHLVGSSKLSRMLHAPLVDIILSGLCAIFFLAVGAAVAARGSCDSSLGIAVIVPSGARLSSNLADYAAARGGTIPYSVSDQLLAATDRGGKSAAAVSSSGGDSSSSSSISDVFASLDPYTSAGLMSNISAAQHEMTMSIISNIGRRMLHLNGAAHPSTTFKPDLRALHTGVTNSHRSLAQTKGSSKNSNKQQAELVCSTWNTVTAMGFINMLLYAVSAVLAGLRYKAKHGLPPSPAEAKPTATAAATAMGAAGHDAAAEASSAVSVHVVDIHTTEYKP